MDIIEILKVIVLGIIEGVTEWLPISSTGHMLLADQFLKLNMTEAFKTMFFYVIQLGAILAVVVVFWKKMVPIGVKGKLHIKKDVLSLWLKVLFACVPAIIAGLLFDDYVDEHLSTPLIIASTLIIYGVLFIVIEAWNKKRPAAIKSINDINYNAALVIGLFQVLAIIPGTSRSGATIIGALLIGVSRVAAAEFTFFLAVPVMFGVSALKIFKFGLDFTTPELLTLGIGMLVAFVVSLLAIKFLMGYIKKHDFKVFGWYRIVLGIIVLIYFGLIVGKVV